MRTLFVACRFSSDQRGQLYDMAVKGLRIIAGLTALDYQVPDVNIVKG